MATKAKTKAATVVPQNREEVQDWIAQLGTLQRERAVLETSMNDEIGAATKKYATDIADLADKEATQLAGISTWCEANKAELTKDGKTVNFGTGTVAWRSNPPSVTFKKGLKVEQVIAYLRQLKLAKLFVRTTEVVNKEAILSAEPKIKAKLTAAGTIKIVDDAETFSVTPFEQEVVV